MRLFIASPVRIYKHRKIVEDFSPFVKGRWVSEENLHLTWVFLGERDDVNSILEAMYNISFLCERVLIKSMGSFGRPVKIFYAKPQTKELLKKVDEFKKEGFELDGFKPHITLCRVKRILDKNAFREKMEEYKGKKIGEVSKEIRLFESIAQKGTSAFYRDIC